MSRTGERRGFIEKVKEIAREGNAKRFKLPGILRFS